MSIGGSPGAVAKLSMIGVPPVAGFVSKWYILAGAFEANNLAAVLHASGGDLGYDFVTGNVLADHTALQRYVGLARQVPVIRDVGGI